MKKIALIIPYFGTLPDYFDLWLKSVEKNPTITFFLFTNDESSYCYPDNIEVINIAFKDFRSRLQSEFEFEIKLESPYKLCDYKPTYGNVFKKELLQYDFWGFCDVDLIFGDIRKFITDDILDKYDRILTRGHFSLFEIVSA